MSDHTVLERAGVAPGGGNYLAVLGLLCYTEFGGKLRFANKRSDGSDIASKNFNQFIDLLGQDYRDFRNKFKVYGAASPMVTFPRITAPSSCLPRIQGLVSESIHQVVTTTSLRATAET